MKKNLLRNTSFITIAFFLSALFPSCRTGKPATVRDIIGAKITSLYKMMSQEEMMSLDYDKVFSMFDESELEILGTRHWMFDVNVPVVVSVMRSTSQKKVPFWLEVNGFAKTDMTMRNEQVTYEVWQKKFNKGRVGLGINGF